MQIRSVFEGLRICHDAQEGYVTIKSSRKQCGCSRACWIFGGLRKSGTAGVRVPVCGSSFRPLSIYEVGCVLVSRSCRGGRIDGGLHAADNVTVEFRQQVLITTTMSLSLVVSDGHDGSERASVTVGAPPATSRRTKLSEEGGCILDGLFRTGACTHGLFMKVDCPAQECGAMMPVSQPCAVALWNDNVQAQSDTFPG